MTDESTSPAVTGNDYARPSIDSVSGSAPAGPEAGAPLDPPRPIRRRPATLKLPTIRAAIALLGAAAALAVWFLLAPAPLDQEAVHANSHSGQVSGVRSDQKANEVTADSSPQQTVVNTWATVDMLEVMTTQLDDLAQLQATSAVLTPKPDARIPALLLIGVLVFCLSQAAEPLVGARQAEQRIAHIINSVPHTN